MAFLSLIAALVQMPAQAQGSQLEQEALLRDVDALNAAGSHEAALQTARKFVASGNAPYDRTWSIRN